MTPEELHRFYLDKRPHGVLVLLGEDVQTAVEEVSRADGPRPLIENAINRLAIVRLAFAVGDPGTVLQHKKTLCQELLERIWS